MLVVASVVIYWELVQGVDGFAQQIAVIELKLDDLEFDRTQAKTSADFLEANQAVFKEINDFYIQTDRPVDFIETLEGLGRKTQTSILINLINNNDKKNKNFSFRINSEGAEKNVIQFLKLTELMPYVITVKSLSFEHLTEGSQGSARARLSFEVTVETL